MKKVLTPFILLLGIFLISGCGDNQEETKTPIDEDDTVVMIEDQQIGSLNIHSFNINFDEEDQLSYIYFEVENTSSETANVSTITYKLYEDDVLIISIPEDLEGPIEAGDSRIITTSVDLKLETDKVEYEVK